MNCVDECGRGFIRLTETTFPLPARAGSRPGWCRLRLGPAVPTASEVPGTALGMVQRGLELQPTPNSQVTAQTDPGCHQPPPDGTTGRAGLRVATGRSTCHMGLVTCGHLARSGDRAMVTERQFCHQIIFLP